MTRFRFFKALFSLVCLLAFAFTSNAQTPAPTPTVVLPDQHQPQNVIGNPACIVRASFVMNDSHKCPKLLALKRNKNNANSRMATLCI